MKLFLLFAFCLIFLSAETENLTDEYCENCQAVFPEKRVEDTLKSIFYKEKYKTQQLIKKSNSYAVISINDKSQKIKELEDELILLKEQLKEKNKIITTLNQKLSQNSSSQKWITITVDNNLNIYDLALKYYGDSQEYENIYMANQNKIDENYQIRNGMSLKIPITENFIEQPICIH